MSTTNNPATGSNQLATSPNGAFALSTYEDMNRMAENVAKSGMFGIQNAAQAMCLFALCAAENITPGAALRRYHIVEGRFSMRADSMQGEFTHRGGGILWHCRNDEVAAATFFADAKKMDDKAIERSKARYAALKDGDNKTAEELAYPGEECVIRTFKHAVESKLAMSWDKEKREWKLKNNWNQSRRQMLTARCVTEGVRLTDPGLIAGIVSEDEALDIASQQQNELMEQAFGGQASERTAALQKIIEEKRKMADEAATQADKRRIFGEIATMQAELDNDEGERIEAERLAREREATATPSVPATTDNAPELLPKDTATPAASAKKPTKEEDWRTVDFSHLNLTTTHSCFGSNLGDLFEKGSLDKAQRIMTMLQKPGTGYMTKIAALKHSHPESLSVADARLYDALLKASERISERLETEQPA